MRVRKILGDRLATDRWLVFFTLILFYLWLAQHVCRFTDGDFDTLFYSSHIIDGLPTLEVNFVNKLSQFNQKKDENIVSSGNGKYPQMVHIKQKMFGGHVPDACSSQPLPGSRYINVKILIKVSSYRILLPVFTFVCRIPTTRDMAHFLPTFLVQSVWGGRVTPVLLDIIASRSICMI